MGWDGTWCCGLDEVVVLEYVDTCAESEFFEDIGAQRLVVAFHSHPGATNLTRTTACGTGRMNR